MTHSRNRVIGLLTLLALTACDDGPAVREPAADAPDPTPSAAAALTRAPVAPIEILAFDSVMARGLEHRGTMVEGRRWRDSLGEHVMILTQTGAFPSATPTAPGEDPLRDAEIYAYDYLRRGDGWELLWRTTDFQRDCVFDLFAGFVPSSVSVTDVDADGLAEATFLYTLACRSDVSPATRKLIMHEGATKYAIRGTTDVSRMVGAEYGRGTREIDPSFESAAPAVRAYAVREWERFVAVDEFDQI